MPIAHRLILPISSSITPILPNNSWRKRGFASPFLLSRTIMLWRKNVFSTKVITTIIALIRQILSLTTLMAVCKELGYGFFIRSLDFYTFYFN